MRQKLIFQQKNEKEFLEFLTSNKSRRTLNFLNLHDLYQRAEEPLSKKSLSGTDKMNFIDGFAISAYLSITNLKRIPRVRGPTFTKDFLSNPTLSKNKTHFFIGLEQEDLKKLKTKLPHLTKISSYNPPYIKSLEFSKEEIKKMSSLINKKKPDYVWVGIGCPKQNILSSKLKENTKAQYFVNIGAALDFLLEKKAEAPLIVRELGIEWLYRLITDFKYSKKKVWRSLISLKNITDVKLKD